MKSVLRVEGLRQNYGGVQALRGVSFELQAGECVALIGPNGAGKSTCFACLAGQQKALAGSLVWRGHDLQQSTVEMRTRLGVARTFQVAQVFEALTVLQNLQLVLQASRGVSMRDLLAECLLDEPAAGLAPEERADMMERVKRMARLGATVLYTEHNMDAVFGVADRVLVLIDGQLVTQGSPQEVAANQVVRERYLGQTFSLSKELVRA